jgi:hypothetical protein
MLGNQPIDCRDLEHPARLTQQSILVEQPKVLEVYRL